MSLLPSLPSLKIKSGEKSKGNNPADYLGFTLSTTYHFPPLKKRKKKAMIRIPVLNKYPWIISYISLKATTNEKYFLISRIFCFKTGPGTCTSPSESHRQRTTKVVLMANRMFCVCMMFSARKDHCSHHHLAVKMGHQRWTSKTEAATARSCRRKAGERWVETGPERPLLAPRLLFPQPAGRKAEPLSCNFQLPNNHIFKQRD